MGARPLPSGPLSTEERHPLIEKLQERRDHHKTRAKPIRVLYAMVGATLLLGGLVMLVTPGPAFAVIPIGLFLLALEFTWAEAALEKSLEQAEKAKRKAAETTTTQRVLTGAAVALAVAGFAAWAILGDVPLLPV
ncbi:MAG: PGPGW domain-containing protein [Solirubrobacterales bacterium]|nr:PGPGW domain-containing protein [Solirubrobacterales bacterium]